MNKKASMWMTFIFICLVGIYFLVQKDARPSNVTKSNTGIDFVTGATVNNQNILSVSTTTVTSTNLHPKFDISLKNNADLRHLRIDGLDMLGDESLRQGVSSSSKSFSFETNFLLEPGAHEIDIVANLNSESQEIKTSFILAYEEGFDVSNDLGLFIIPDNTKASYGHSWYVDGGRLHIDKLSKSDHASLAFLYPMGDTDVSFDLIPKGPNVSLAFYFLDSNRTIVIGNGNDRRITLLKEKPSIDGESFIFEKDKSYRIRIVRKAGLYDVYVKNVGDDVWTHSLAFDDSLIPMKDSAIGFTLWSVSDGVEIDNIRIQ